MVDAVSVEVGPQCRGLQQMAISSWKMDRCFAVQRQDGEKAIRFAESGDSPDTSSRSEVLLEQYARIVRGTATGANRAHPNAGWVLKPPVSSRQRAM